jgi:multicomponent Na+:H+ antiporter subunit D
VGLLTKGGIFVSGLWLPLTHSESETPVSAMLSGVVVKAGVFPLVRCALMVEEIAPIVRIFAVGSIFLGVVYAILEKDTKRTLASSTISQLGWVMAAPAVAGFYALAHGLVKSALFLIAGNLPSRNFQELQKQGINTSMWLALVIASLSMSGFPLLFGFGAKMLTLKNVESWQFMIMNVAAVGTAIVFAKFIFLPHKTQLEENPGKKLTRGFWLAITLLIGGLIAANILYVQAYTIANMIKAVVIIILGWLAYFLILRRMAVKLPRVLEQFEHLIGVMSLILMLLLGMILA